MAEKLTIDTSVAPARDSFGVQRGRGLSEANVRPEPIHIPAPADTSQEYFRGLNQSISGLAGTGQAILKDMQANEIATEATNVIKSVSAYQVSATQKLEGLDRLDPEYQKNVDTILGETQKDISDSSNVYSKHGKEELDARLTAVQGQFKIQTLQAQRKSQQEDTLRTYDTAYNAVGQAIRKNPDQMEAILAGWKTDADRLTASLDTDTKGKVDFKLKSDSIALQALGYADKGNFAKAKSVIDSNAGSLDRSQEQKVTYQIHAIKSQQESDGAKYAANVASDISAKLSDWAINPNPTAEPPYSRDQLQKMKDGGMFYNNPGLYSSLVHQLNSVYAHRDAQMASTRLAMDQYSKNTIPDQSSADRAWNYVQNGQLGKDKTQANPLDEGVTDSMVKFASQTGYIPSSYKNFVNNVSAESGPGDQSPAAIGKLAMATMLYDKVSKALPNMKWSGSADDKDATVATAHQLMMNENLSATEAARRTIALTPKDKEVSVLRSKDYVEEIGKMRGPSVKREDFMAKSVSDNFQPSIISGAGLDRLNPFTPGIKVNAEVANAYDKRFETAYIQSGDKAVAKAVADEWAKKNYSLTNIGADKNTVAEYAPEHFVNPTLLKGVPQNIVSEIFNNELKLKLDLAGMSSKPEDYRLNADSRTKAEADAFKKNGDGQVTFALQVKDAVGNFVPVPGGRWAVPTVEEMNKTPQMIDLRKKQMEEFEGVRRMERFGQEQSKGSNAGLNKAGRAIGGYTEEVFGAGQGSGGTPKNKALPGAIEGQPLERKLREQSRQYYKPSEGGGP